jgi:hypothetical protein
VAWPRARAEVPLPRWFRRYVLSFAVATVLLPLATIIAAPFALGRLPGAAVQRAAAPALFLLLAQLLMESTTEAAPRRWAALVRILNPIGFNAMRLWPLCDWLLKSVVLAGVGLDAVAPPGARLFLQWAALLAAVNCALWLYNLLGFLLPVALPNYLDERRFAT